MLQAVQDVDDAGGAVRCGAVRRGAARHRLENFQEYRCCAEARHPMRGFEFHFKRCKARASRAQDIATQVDGDPQIALNIHSFIHSLVRHATARCHQRNILIGA